MKQVFQKVIANWDHDEPALSVTDLYESFGTPANFGMFEFTWEFDSDSSLYKKGYRRVTVRDEYIKHDFPTEHYDYLYTTFFFPNLTVTKAQELINVSKNILIDLLKKEVTVRCSSLITNDVTLDFVYDVLEGHIPPSKTEYSKRINKSKIMNPDVFVLND